MKALGTRLERLEQKVDIKAAVARQEEARRRQKANDQIVTHFGRTLDPAWPLLSEEQQQRLQPEAEDPFSKWALEPWLRSLLDGSSKLPDLTCAPS